MFYIFPIFKKRRRRRGKRNSGNQVRQENRYNPYYNDRFGNPLPRDTTHISVIRAKRRAEKQDKRRIERNVTRILRKNIPGRIITRQRRANQILHYIGNPQRLVTNEIRDRTLCARKMAKIRRAYIGYTKVRAGAGGVIRRKITSGGGNEGRFDKPRGC